MTDQPDENPKPKLPALRTGGAVTPIIPQSFDEVYRIANAVCVADMAPYGLHTPEKATIAIMHGMEVGLTPMMALQSIAIINNRPSLWGDAVLGLVQASGKLEWHKEWIEGEGDNRVARFEAKRVNDKEIVRTKFSVADAKTAKLWMKTGNKGQDTPWITGPDRMLQMRARGFGLRDKFADVLKGLAVAEEQRDIETMKEDAQPLKAPKPDQITAPKPTTAPKPDEAKPSLVEQVQALERQQEEKKDEAQPDSKVVDVDELDGSDLFDDGSAEDTIGDHTPETQAGTADSDQAQEPLAPGEVLEKLSADVMKADTLDALQEVWLKADIKATFSHLGEEADHFTGMAMGIRAARERELKARKRK